MTRLITLRKCLPPVLWMLAATVLLTGLVSTGNAQDPSGRPSSSKHKKNTKPKEKDTTPEAITIDLTVLTQPGGCQVYVNGELRGTTNDDGKIEFNKLAQGHYTIEVRRAGFVSSSRGFEAGSEAPTLEFKLKADIGDKVKQIDSLMTAGKLLGPESPNAYDLVDDLGKNFPDRPEVANLRAALFLRLMDNPEEQSKQITGWREIDRDVSSKAQMLAAKAEVLKPDSKHAQALDLFFQGVGALRDWQAGLESASAGSAEQNPAEAKLEEARDKLRKAVQLEDTLTAAQYQLGAVLLLSNDAAGAEAAFGKAAQLEPSLTAARIRIGDAFYAEGKRKDAVAQYRKAVEMDGKSIAAHSGLGLALAMTGQAKEGMKELETAISLDQNAALPHFDLGLVLAESKKKKDRTRAEEELKKAIELNPKNMDFQNRAASSVLAGLGGEKRK